MQGQGRPRTTTQRLLTTLQPEVLKALQTCGPGSLTSVSIAWGERGVEEGLVLGLLALALGLALASSLEGLLPLRRHPAC